MSIRTNTKYKIMKLGNNNTKRKCDNTKKKKYCRNNFKNLIQALQ